MVCQWVLFCPIVGIICFPWFPIILELLTIPGYTTNESACPLLLLLLVLIFHDNSVCDGVVILDWHWWLKVPHFVQCGLHDDGLFGIKVKGAEFCFCCQLHF